MTTPTGGTPASPPPPPYTAPTSADRRRRTLRNVGILAAIAIVVIFLATQCGWRIDTDSTSSEGTSPSETTTPTTAPPVSDPEAEVPPVVPATDIASCGVIWSWKSFDDCVDKVASWMPAEWDKPENISKLPYAHVEDWAKRFPNAEARVIFVYNDAQPIMTDDEVRAKAAAEAKLDPSVAARLDIVRVERDFPGWFVINTGNLENKRMNPFPDQRPEQVRVSLAPLDKDGKIDLRMAGEGAFVTCFNKHRLEQDKPVESTPPGTTTCCDITTTTTTPSTVTTTTTPSTSTTTTTPSTSTTTTTTSTTTTSTTTTETSPPKDPDGGADETIVMPSPSETDAETSPPSPSPTPLDPTRTSDAPTAAPPVEETPDPPSVPADLPSEEVTTTVTDPGSQG